MSLSVFPPFLLTLKFYLKSTLFGDIRWSCSLSVQSLSLFNHGLTFIQFCIIIHLRIRTFASCCSCPLDANFSNEKMIITVDISSFAISYVQKSSLSIFADYNVIYLIFGLPIRRYPCYFIVTVCRLWPDRDLCKNQWIVLHEFSFKYLNKKFMSPTFNSL